ncbi:hypothetical protein KIH74_22835 [Kineosporia sp. J2-2]|uniref:Uncharacterized protein n=1 Tax=Kineosporia corallincola TaxID=2835133 RepID=A0ABS5TL11_9ACTN|nr:hypothetical protein [Kineosporia corallincola]MBT0771795.1 hypothetical protein [Kineosporia corallincola]
MRARPLNPQLDGADDAAMTIIDQPTTIGDLNARHLGSRVVISPASGDSVTGTLVSVRHMAVPGGDPLVSVIVEVSGRDFDLNELPPTTRATVLS